MLLRSVLESYYDNNNPKNNEYVITLRVAKMYIPLISPSWLHTCQMAVWWHNTRSCYTGYIRISTPSVPILNSRAYNSPITRINGSFADCYCDISRVELLLYVVEIVFNCNKEVIEDLMVITS